MNPFHTRRFSPDRTCAAAALRGAGPVLLGGFLVFGLPGSGVVDGIPGALAAPTFCSKTATKLEAACHAAAHEDNLVHNSDCLNRSVRAIGRSGR